MQQNQKCVILLTACVDPKGMPFLKRNNPLIREEDYIKSLLFWKQEKYKIVFCENSGWNLSKIKETIKENKQIEYLQYISNPDETDLGKGFGEMQLIKYAFENSSFINEADIIIKVTGRYIIKNIKRIINYHKTTFNRIDLVCNLIQSMTWADSRIFMAKKFFFTDYLFGMHHEINDQNNVYFEHVLARAIHKAMADGKLNIDSFVSLPIINGYYGTADKKYSHNLLKYFIKNILHKL